MTDVTTLFPGAIWVPVPGHESRPKRRKGRGVGYHVAAYVGPSIEKIDEGTGNDSHLYVRFDGTIEQNIDLDVISYAMVDGNPTLITVETEGGANPATVETEPWTAAQVVSNARIARWAHDTEGVPLQLMPDSKPTSRGLGPHRLGVQHSRGIGAVPGWLIAGGERWSTSIGKLCPGTAKIAQLPQIVALAAGNQEDDLTPDQANQLQQIFNGMFYGGPSLPGGLPLAQAAAHAVWQSTVTRADATGKLQQIPAIQELADAKSQAIAANAALASVVQELASTKGVDPAAIGQAVQDAVTAALAASTVKVDVNVAGSQSATS